MSGHLYLARSLQLSEGRKVNSQIKYGVIRMRKMGSDINLKVTIYGLPGSMVVVLHTQAHLIITTTLRDRGP